MQRTKQYRKGKHLYIKSGSKTEVHTLKNDDSPQVEFDDNCQEFYVDVFEFGLSEKGIKIFFGKKIFGTDRAKPKQTILLPKGTAKRMLRLLETVLKDNFN